MHAWFDVKAPLIVWRRYDDNCKTTMIHLSWALNITYMIYCPSLIGMWTAPFFPSLYSLALYPGTLNMCVRKGLGASLLYSLDMCNQRSRSLSWLLDDVRLPTHRLWLFQPTGELHYHHRTVPLPTTHHRQDLWSLWGEQLRRSQCGMHGGWCIVCCM